MLSPAPLRPREHGAYAMLVFPVASGLALGGLSWAGVAFALLAGSGFLAHESVSIIRGARGERLRSGHANDAHRRLVGLGLTAFVCGIVFVATAWPTVWGPALLTALLAAAVTGLLLAGRTKSILGELLVGATFASVHAVIASAGGSPPDRLYVPVGVWIASFSLSTLAVHALKRRFKGRGPAGWTVTVAPALAVGLLALAVAAWMTGSDHAMFAIAPAPKALVVLGTAIFAIHPRHLMRIGWSFVVADTATLILMAAAFSPSLALLR